MIFTPVDLDSWERRSHYEYYTKLLKCGYSVTVSLDITKLHRQVKEKGLRFYPAADPSLSYFAVFFVAATSSNTMKIP